jgi:protein TonB
MELKKSPEANLERTRMLYIIVGALFAVAVLYSAMEYKTYGKEISNLGAMDVEEEVVELPPITRATPPPPPPPPPPPVAPPVIEVVEDEVEVKEMEELIELDENDILEEIPELEEEEVVVPQVRVEKMPSFPGCEDEPLDQRELCTQKKIQNHVMRAYKHPAIAKEHSIKGRVFVRFVIAASGKVEQIEILRSAHKVLEDPVIAAVKSLPTMNPGVQLGKKVPVYFTLPVNITY